MSDFHEREKIRKIREYLKHRQETAGEWDLSHLKFKVPLDPQLFYEDVGLMMHDKKKTLIKKLAAYQTTAWQWGFRYKYRMIVKSQKIGFSTSAAMEDFQRAVLPPKYEASTMGYETLIIAQSNRKAKDHLDTIYKWVRNSDKYRDFVIEKSRPYLRKTEVSKTTEMLIENPYNPTQPSKIIALGGNPSAIWSWKKVKHIHMSDIASVKSTEDAPIYDAAFTRLAITQGTMMIESPPMGQRGQMYEIYKASKLGSETKGPDAYSQFKIMEIPYTAAIDAGVTEKSWFESEKVRMGPRFGQYYECEFLNPYNTWYDDSLFSYDANLQLDE